MSQALGFSGSTLEWIRDYLKDRKQFAVVNVCKSQLNAVKCGIPQGSLLGRRLFSFNDLPDQIKEGEIDMYADDTTLFYIGPSVDVVCDALNRVLGDVHNWCRNKLTIHSGKSEVTVLNRNSFCGPLKPVILGDRILSYVNSSVCLGVVIDSRLSWQPQITAVCTKSFSRKVKNLTQLRVLPRRVLEAIYFRSIVPRVTDGLLVWGTCTLSCYVMLN